MGIKQTETSLELQLITQKPITYHSFMLTHPNRFVIDIDETQLIFQPPIDDLIKRTALIKNIRYAHYTEHIFRVVIDLVDHVTLQAPIVSEQTSYKGSTSLLIFAFKIPSKRLMQLPTTSLAMLPVPKKKPHILPPFYRYRPTIVIDAGHGGVDDGATGKHGLKEKHLTLRYARLLKEALETNKRYHVILTREDDRYISITERIEQTIKSNGDLFISLHADANDDAHVKGFSVYTLSEIPSDKDAAALAQRENTSNQKFLDAYDINVSAAVVDVILDLAKAHTQHGSQEFASKLIEALSKSQISALKNPHRSARFSVLTNPNMPSVLIELGYLSNKTEEKRLQHAAYQKEMIHLLARAIDHYFQESGTLHSSTHSVK